MPRPAKPARQNVARRGPGPPRLRRPQTRCLQRSGKSAAPASPAEPRRPPAPPAGSLALRPRPETQSRVEPYGTQRRTPALLAGNPEPRAAAGGPRLGELPVDRARAELVRGGRIAAQHR